MADSTLVTTEGGDLLALQEWPIDDGVALRGVVVISHGLGEHGGRYEALAQWLTQQGFAVRAPDHYGHGDSQGKRGTLLHDDQLVDDLNDVLFDTRVRLPRGTPLILLGHSMGGAVAAQHAAMALDDDRRVPVDALVLSSPALDTGMTAMQRTLVSALLRWAPNLTLSNGLKVQALSHDPAVVGAYQSDRRVHNRISARLACAIDTAGPIALKVAPRWRTPTLLLWAEADQLVAPAGSHAFAAAAAPRVVTAIELAGAFHEIFNEAEPWRGQALAALDVWLHQVAPARSA
jgi:alpha-beta hydrolase superfamily lysophospholipase